MVQLLYTVKLRYNATAYNPVITAHFQRPFTRYNGP